MGNQTPAQQAIPKHIFHERLGQCLLENGNILVSEVIEQENFKAWENKLFAISGLDCQNILLPLSYNFTRNTCTQTGKLELTYPAYMFTLTGEIQHRRLQKEYFDEQELLYLAFSLAKNGVIEQSLKERANTFSIANLLINQKGHVKMINPFTSPNIRSNLKSSMEQCHDCFLSPQQMTSLSKNQLRTGTENCISQTFCLGLILLEIATLEPSSSLFDFTCWKVHQDLIQKRLASLEQRYSRQVIGIMHVMLELQPKRRPCVGQVYYYMKGHGSQIVALQRFKWQEEKCMQNVKQFIKLWNENPNELQLKKLAPAFQDYFQTFSKPIPKQIDSYLLTSPVQSPSPSKSMDNPVIQRIQQVGMVQSVIYQPQHKRIAVEKQGMKQGGCLPMPKRKKRAVYHYPHFSSLIELARTRTEESKRGTKHDN